MHYKQKFLMKAMKCSSFCKLLAANLEYVHLMKTYNLPIFTNSSNFQKNFDGIWTHDAIATPICMPHLLFKHSKINENNLSMLLQLALEQMLMILNECRFRIENDKLFNIHICTDLLWFHICWSSIFYSVQLDETLCSLCSS